MTDIERAALRQLWREAKRIQNRYQGLPGRGRPLMDSPTPQPVAVSTEQYQNV
jgi:hypothetical protein